MDRVLEITLSDRMAQLFKFLSNNKTLTLKNGKYIKLVYFVPFDTVVYPLTKKGMTVTVNHKLNVDSWTVVRQLEIAIAGDDLLAVLDDLTVSDTKDKRTGSKVIDDWLLDRVKFGLFEPSDVVYLVRYLFGHGYSYDDVVGVFSSLCKRQSLMTIFLNEVNKLYMEVSA